MNIKSCSYRCSSRMCSHALTLRRSALACIAALLAVNQQRVQNRAAKQQCRVTRDALRLQMSQQGRKKGGPQKDQPAKPAPTAPAAGSKPAAPSTKGAAVPSKPLASTSGPLKAAHVSKADHHHVHKYIYVHIHHPQSSLLFTRQKHLTQ